MVTGRSKFQFDIMMEGGKQRLSWASDDQDIVAARQYHSHSDSAISVRRCALQIVFASFASYVSGLLRLVDERAWNKIRVRYTQINVATMFTKDAK